MDWLFYEIDISVCAYILLALVAVLELKEYFTYVNFTNKKRDNKMHKRIACHRCGVFEDLGCGCTSTQLAIQAELEMDAFEKQHAKGSWTDKQMVNHLRENGYRVEKRSPNPKKRKRAHRKLVQFKDY